MKSNIVVIIAVLGLAYPVFHRYIDAPIISTSTTIIAALVTPEPEVPACSVIGVLI